MAPYRPSVQPLQPLALHHQHPTTPTLPGPVPPTAPDSTSYSNKMASLDLSPTDSPNVTLTIRLIMQGKVSTPLPSLPWPTTQHRVLRRPQFPVSDEKPLCLATVEYIQRERARKRCRGRKVYLVKMQFAQLSLSFPFSSLHYFPKLHLPAPARPMEKFFAGNRRDDFASRKLLTQQHLFVNPGVNSSVFGRN